MRLSPIFRNSSSRINTVQAWSYKTHGPRAKSSWESRLIETGFVSHRVSCQSPKSQLRKKTAWLNPHRFSNKKHFLKGSKLISNTPFGPIWAPSSQSFRMHLSSYTTTNSSKSTCSVFSTTVLLATTWFASKKWTLPAASLQNWMRSGRKLFNNSTK